MKRLRSLSGGLMRLTVVALLCGNLFAAPGPTEPDIPTWTHCTLPENEYIGVHAERRESGDAPWRSVVNHLQPFRSKTDRTARFIFWRKDDPADYYGEFFTYDDGLIRLHTETFPPPTHLDPPDGPEWHNRPDRLRLFVDALDNDWRVGRVLAPVRFVPDWTWTATVNTYLANSFEEITGGTAVRYQTGVRDYTTVTVEAPFSTVYDGMAEGWTPDPEFTEFDEALIINQHMNDNAARERFIFARKGDQYFGIVRWDESYLADGEWEVRVRTIGLRRVTQSEPFSFEGMYERARALGLPKGLDE